MNLQLVVDVVKAQYLLFINSRRKRRDLCTKAREETQGFILFFIYCERLHIAEANFLAWVSSWANCRR
jgi:hypothetical protein